MRIKLKTKSSAKKRFKITGKNIIKHKQSYLRHILTKKSSKRKRNLRTLKELSCCHVKAIKRLLN